MVLHSLSKEMCLYASAGWLKLICQSEGGEKPITAVTEQKPAHFHGQARQARLTSQITPVTATGSSEQLIDTNNTSQTLAQISSSPTLKLIRGNADHNDGLYNYVH